MMEMVLGAMAFGVPLLQGESMNRQQLRQGEQQHQAEIRLDIELARRDVLQGMRDQKADKLETLLVMDTLLLGCSFGMLVEGIPPRHSWWLVVALFSVTLALSISMFFLSCWFIMKVQSLMGRYNILNPDHLYPCKEKHVTFHSYFRCHCEALARRAVELFYGGVLTLFISGSILLYLRFLHKHHVPEAGVIFIVISLILLLVVACLERMIPVGTLALKTEAELLTVGGIGVEKEEKQ